MHIMPELDTQTKTVVVKRILNNPREEVFRAWTEVDAITQWFAPEGFTTRSAEIDLQVGGKYRFEIQFPEGETCYNYGTYREIIFPEKLVFTWNIDWPGKNSDDYPAESLVTVEFQDLGAATELTITHELIATEKARDELEYGWSSGLDGLVEYLS